MIQTLAGLAIVWPLCRLLAFGFEFAGESIQTDFAAYYTAGQMVAAGLSPYRYLITPERIIWTSGDTYRHAQYIYPPLLAAVFAPVAQNMSYLMAKYAWWFLDLIGLASVLSFSRRALRLPFRPWGVYNLIFVGLFHPLYVNLLRGQIDLITAALIGVAFYLLSRRKCDYVAGGLLGIAALFKFHAGFIFPFLLIRRRFRAAAGFGLGALVMVGLNFVMAGPVNVERYLAELPRISQYGGDGPPGSELPPEAMALIRPLLGDPKGVVKDGYHFPNSGFNFVTNASFVELICCGLGFNLPRPTASLSVLAFFVFAFGLLSWRSHLFPPLPVVQLANGRGDQGVRADEYIYWFAIINVALLAGPTTWTMNVVWLLPAFPILIYLWRSSDRAFAFQLALVLFTAGLLLVAMPDHRSFPALFPRALVRLSIYKYPAGELLLILGSVLYLRRQRLMTRGSEEESLLQRRDRREREENRASLSALHELRG